MAIIVFWVSQGGTTELLFPVDVHTNELLDLVIVQGDGNTVTAIGYEYKLAESFIHSNCTQEDTLSSREHFVSLGNNNV